MLHLWLSVSPRDTRFPALKAYHEVSIPLHSFHVPYNEGFQGSYVPSRNRQVRTPWFTSTARHKLIGYIQELAFRALDYLKHQFQRVMPRRTRKQKREQRLTFFKPQGAVLIDCATRWMILLRRFMRICLRAISRIKTGDVLRRLQTRCFASLTLLSWIWLFMINKGPSEERG